MPAKRLGTLVNQLVSLGVHQQWLNLIFTETNNPENSLQTLGKLVQDFTKINNLSEIQKAKATINSMQAQIPQWDDPAKFPELFKGLQANISDLNKQLKWQPEGSNLQKILILEQVNQLTDILDKSTKSLERSTLYSNNAKDEKGNDLQVARFKDMITEFYGLMKVWVAEGRFKSDRSAQRSLEVIDELLLHKGTQILTKEQFNPSPNFAVNRATINITDTLHLPRTLEDFFTLVHQNMIVAITDLATEANKILSKQLPDLVSNLDMAFNTQLIDSGNSHEPGKIITPSTMISLKDQILTTEKNIPLRSHSCIANIKYNVKDGTSVKFTMLGVNEQDRWDNIELDTYLQLTKAGIEFKILPRHDEKKGVFEYEIKIKEGQIASLINVINKSIDISYKLSLENRKEASSSRQKLLVDRLDLLSKFSNAELNKVANMAKIMLMEPEKFGQFELLGGSNLERLTTLFQFCNKNELVRAIIGNLGSLAEKLPNLYIDNILDSQETLNSSTWEFLKSKSPYNQEIFIDKLFALQNSEDNKSLNLFKDILIQGSKDLVSVLDQNTQLFFIEKLFKLQDNSTFRATVNEILIKSSDNWLQNLDSSNKQILKSKLLEHKNFEEIDKKNRFISLTSDSTEKIFKEEYVTREQLGNLETDKIKLLISATTLNMYEKQYVIFDQLKGLDTDKLEILTSWEAIEAYKNGIKFDQLQGLDKDKFRLLVSWGAIDAYKNGIKFDQLKDLNKDKFGLLTSLEAIDAYESGIKFEQLENIKDLNLKKLNALTSYNVREEVYNKKYATFDDLKNLVLDKIQDMTSSMAQINYARGVTFTFLKHYGFTEDKYGITQGDILAHLYPSDPAKADKQQIKQCVEAIAKEYPGNNLEFNKAIDDFVDKLAVSRQITNQGADNSPEETRKYLVTTLEQLAKDNSALSTPLERIKLSNVAQSPAMQAAAAVLASHAVAGYQDSNMSIKKESFVESVSKTSNPTTQRR